MMDDDLPDAARHATAANVLQCLVMLAEEAVNLNLPRTMLALRKGYFRRSGLLRVRSIASQRIAP
jgi:hypothetical protein